MTSSSDLPGTLHSVDIEDNKIVGGVVEVEDHGCRICLTSERISEDVREIGTHGLLQWNNGWYFNAKPSPRQFSC
jgi:hypothetical protein